VEGDDPPTIEELAGQLQPCRIRDLVSVTRGCVVEIGRELCSALAVAHDRGIIHRDLKPGNVWLTEDGASKLGDFGIAVPRRR